MAKEAYRVRNWSDYNKSLVNRGRITLWIDEESIDKWYASDLSTPDKGRPAKYSDVAIQMLLVLKQVYRLTLRGCRGFTLSLFELMNLTLDVPCYSRICRRQADISLPRLPTCPGSIHMVVDSTGLKLYGEGEWKVRQHGYSKHRMWRKLHLGVDEKSGLIVSALLTENNCGDDKKLPEILDNYRGKFHQVSADGAYDSHDCFNLITQYGAIPTIPTQKNSRHPAKKEEDIKRPRDKVVWQIQQKGRKEWKQQSGYHRRSLAETTMYRYKQLLGDKLSARKLDNQRAEALVKCHILNKITACGMPISEKK